MSAGCCGGSGPATQFADITAFENDNTELSTHVFLLINGSSGGNKAKALLSLHLQHFRMKTDDPRCDAWVWFCDLKAQEKRNETAQQIKSFSKDLCLDCRVIACGGDGTVKWVIEILKGIDCLDVPVGVIPFGTGNDMSRISGWGGSPPRPLIGKNMRALKRRIRKVLKAAVEDLDVWEVEIVAEDDGEFLRVEGANEERIEKDGSPIKVMKEEMINYFSIGADAKIVVEFEKNRKSTQLANKVEYARQLSKQLMAPEPKLSMVLKSARGEGKADILSRLQNKRMVVFQNIPSYAAGMKIWGKRDGRTITDGDGIQEIGDRLLEAVSVKSPERVILKTSKVAQQGEYHLDFHPDSGRVYVQVDGEGRVVVGPSSITIKHGFQVKLLNAKAVK